MKSLKAYFKTRENQPLQSFSENAPIEKLISDEVFIIDAMNLFIRNFSISKILDKRGHHIGGLVGSLNSVYAIIRNYKPSQIIFIFEGDNSTVRRKKLYKEYKANRKGKGVTNKSVFFNDEEAEESFNWQLLTFIQYLQNLPLNILSIDEYEADDIIGWLATKSSLKSNNITIVSTDQDYLQLVSSNIKVYSPIKKIVYKNDTVLNEFGLHSHNFLLYKTLIGDKSDNIIGVKGLQLKTLLKIFPNISNIEKIVLEDLIKFCQNKMLDKKSYKVFNEIVNSENLIKLNEHLMDLCDINIPKLVANDIEDELSKTRELNLVECVYNSTKHYMDEHLFKPPQYFFTEFNYLTK